MTNQFITEIISLQPIYRHKADKYPYKRPLYHTLTQNHSHLITGISGLRGSGKTILLYQLLQKSPHHLYLSLDTLPIKDLFALIKILHHRYQYTTFLLDEIHHLPHYSQQLKKIHDILDVKIIFTSSISLDLLHTKEDLARRVQIFYLPILSLREYLLLKHQIKLPLLSLQELLSLNPFPHLSILEEHFLDYLETPLAAQLQTPSPQIITNIITRIIDSDLIQTNRLSNEDRINLKLILNFLSQIKKGDISLTQLAKNIQITKYKAQRYINLLQQSFLVHSLMPYGTNVLREPKILLNLPFRPYLAKTSSQQILGSLKEDFFVTTMQAINQTTLYLKTNKGKKTPDFFLPELKTIIEIGGKTKGFSQFKDFNFHHYQQKIATYPYRPKSNSLPLVYFGLLF